MRINSCHTHMRLCFEGSPFSDCFLRASSNLEATRKVTSKRVQIDPNEAFANITAIRRAQIEAGEVSPDEITSEDDSDDSEDSSTSTEEGSCIMVVGN